MTDDSIQIAATSHAQRRAHETMRESVGERTVADVVFRHRRTPVARQRGAALRPEGKFSALQSLEKSRNAEGNSIWVGSCVAVSEEAAAESIVDISNRGVASPRSRRERPTESPANGAATP
jgi:hypothetical protein